MSDETKPGWPGDWELVDMGSTTAAGMLQMRQKVPGGWLVLVVASGTGAGSALTFLPDANHAWAPPLKQTRAKKQFDR